MNQKKSMLTGLVFIILFQFSSLSATELTLTDVYPRLANHYLRWGINDYEARKLYPWDVLILDMECQEISQRELQTIRRLHPDIIILVYINPQDMVAHIEYPQFAELRVALLNEINKNDWWLRDDQGGKTTFWPGSYLVNVTDGAGWSDFLPDFVVNRLLSSGQWDGVFYDNLLGMAPYAHGAGIDTDNDGIADNKAFADQKWREGIEKILIKTRAAVGDEYFIVGNSASYFAYQPYLNGRTYESFPTPWEGDGTWTSAMHSYLDVLPKLNRTPLLYTINSNTDNTGENTDYKKMRFGLTSTLMGEGYFSFDHGDTAHAQTWWFDEYDVVLGKAQTNAYNLLNKNDPAIKPGLWRRDFEYGVAIVNSTDKKQSYDFGEEEFIKIQGVQDRAVNDGSIVNWVELLPNDGIILLKIAEDFNDWDAPADVDDHFPDVGCFINGLRQGSITTPIRFRPIPFDLGLHGLSGLSHSSVAE